MLDTEILMDSPVIAAIKDANGLEECLTTECQVIFILYGNVCNIGDIVKKIKDQGKTAIVHMDLIAGLSSKEVSVDFIKQTTPCRRHYQYKADDRETGEGAGTAGNPAFFHD